MKTPRGRPHDLATRLFDYTEDAIYVLVAVLLVVAGVIVLWNTVATLVADARNADLTALLVHLLDNSLLLFIIAELLHTVRVTIQQRTLVVEPFLIVGLIAGVRRLLVLTAQLAAAPNSKFSWSSEGVEIVVLLGLILGMTVALVLYHRYHGAGTREDET